MNSGVEVTYKKDADGLIVRAGAAWDEERPNAQDFVIRGLIASVVTLLAGVVLGMSNIPNPLIAFGPIGIVIFGFALAKMRGPKRALYFDDEGEMHVPFGTFESPGDRQVDWHHDDVVSIEARAQQDQPKIENADRMYEVILLSNDGELVALSRNLEERVALKAAAQLTKALAQLRKDHSGGGEFAGAWGSSS